MRANRTNHENFPTKPIKYAPLAKRGFALGLTFDNGIKTVRYLHTFWLFLRHKTKQVSRNSTHLNFVGTFGNSVARVVTENVFERFVPRITKPDMYLHRGIGRPKKFALGLLFDQRKLAALVFDNALPNGARLFPYSIA